MALYLIGDLHGCDQALQQLLNKISFSPSRDCIYLLGDLVNRGPDSAAVLRRLMGYGASAKCLLGNHDWHLLAVAHGARGLMRKDTFQDVLAAPDCSAMLNWLRQQRLAINLQYHAASYLLVHAGVLPSWSAATTMALASEVEQVLASPELPQFLPHIYGNTPAAWDESLTGFVRLRAILNALTRLRFCTPHGEMEFSSNGSADAAPAGYLPWFAAPVRQTADVRVAFGHWATLGWLGRSDLLALDSGCVWGGRLSAVRLTQDASGQVGHELIQVAGLPASARALA